jgi:hypothetical protein
MTTTANYCVETLVVITIHNHHIKNIVLKNAIESLDIGIIIISFGNALGLIYSNAITTHVRFAKESFPIYIEESLLGLKI